MRRRELIDIGRYWAGDTEMVCRCLKAWLWNQPIWARSDPVWAIIRTAQAMGRDLSAQEAKEMIEDSKAWRGLRRAEALGEYLRLPDEIRTALRIRTIGAHDVTKRARTLRAKAKRRAREAARRHARGAAPRSQSLAQTKPWEAMGISRRQWYRNRKDKIMPITETVPLAGRAPTWTTPVITEVTDPVEEMMIRAACAAEEMAQIRARSVAQIRASYPS